MAIDDSHMLRIATRLGRVGVWRWDMRRNHVEYDEIGRAIFRLRDDESRIDYDTWFELIHPDDRVRIFKDLKRALDVCGDYEGQYRIVRRDGTCGHIREIGQARGDGGKATEMVGVTLDVTRQVELEELMRQKMKMETVGQMAGGIAHDFNNILTTLLTNLELLTVDLAPEAARDAINDSLKAVLRGAALTRKLLTYSKEAAAGSPRDLPARVVNEVADVLRYSAGETVSLHTHCDENAWRCLADENELQTVLFNLVINSRDAMPNGGRRDHSAGNAVIGDEDGQRAGRRLEPGDYLCLSVADTGAGMDPAVLERAAEPFFTTKGLGTGSGLGLPMARSFAEQSGGDLWIDSQPGVGTTVKILLPRTEQEPAHRSPRSEMPPDFGGRRVLVVDDSLEVMGSVSRLLESLGCETVQAASGAGAISRCDRDPGFDFLLLDVVMPGPVTGLRLAEELLTRCPQAAVVFMSGYPEDRLQGGGLHESSFELLTKPFRRSELATALTKAVIRRFGIEARSAERRLTLPPPLHAAHRRPRRRATRPTPIPARESFRSFPSWSRSWRRGATPPSPARSS